jgi:hypothetical protein
MDLSMDIFLASLCFNPSRRAQVRADAGHFGAPQTSVNHNKEKL